MKFTAVIYLAFLIFLWTVLGRVPLQLFLSLLWGEHVVPCGQLGDNSQQLHTTTSLTCVSADLKELVEMSFSLIVNIGSTHTVLRWAKEVGYLSYLIKVNNNMLMCPNLPLVDFHASWSWDSQTFILSELWSRLEQNQVQTMDTWY